MSKQPDATYAEKHAEVVRERNTDAKVRAQDPADIVAWIHGLEDDAESLRGLLEEATEAIADAILYYDAHVPERADGDEMARLRATLARIRGEPKP